MRHERSIIIAQSPKRQSLEQVTETLISTVGGFAGLGKSESSSTITMEKDQILPGEYLKVRIDCDNSKCKNAVKGFKIKLLRNVLALGYNGTYRSNSKYIRVFKCREGCEANA